MQTAVTHPTFKTVQEAAEKAFQVYVAAEKHMTRIEANKIAFDVLVKEMYRETNTQRQ